MASQPGSEADTGGEEGRGRGVAQLARAPTFFV